ncbi:P-loop NTPase fold protein [Streptomyces sp. NPDC006261]|uniref:P-loop NTPase fold protein n=1 Tax=Streptomyces sp. NPDC006261 TaxID=3156739 RepID=UPI0033AA5B94
MLRAYVKHWRATASEITTEPTELKDLTARFLTTEVVADVLASGTREFYDYQSAVEQRENAILGSWGSRSPLRLVFLLHLVILNWQVNFFRRRWTDSLPTALSGQLKRLLRELLGDEHETLLITHNILGLVEVHDLRYMVPSREGVNLVNKLNLMAGGAIGISGPRGVGKSTLLRELAHNEAAGDLLITADIPSAYVPQEFLLTLFQRVCEEFLTLHGRATDSSFLFLITLRKHLLRRFYTALSIWGRLLLAVLLLAIALSPAVATLNSSLEGGITQWLENLWHDISVTVVQAWVAHSWLMRLLLAMLGIGLLVTLTRRRPISPLVKECVNYLYLLRTVQSTSVAATAGSTSLPAVTLGLGRTNTLSSRTLTLPELVVHFRSLLERMALAERRNGRRVFILIDEIDRLGTADQARSLLTDIKSIFGIPNVYFLISVAEDIGADFVRRGLPTRNVVDSSLDDVVHLAPKSLEESHAILQHRAPGLTLPFVTLAHCMAGGITRDLIRSTRRIVLSPESSSSGWRAPDIARELLLEELQETLTSFRTRLSAGDHLDTRLEQLRSTTVLVKERHNVAFVADYHEVLGHLLHATAPLLDASAPQSAQRMWDELGAYIDFILTLLSFFVDREKFPDRPSLDAVAYDGALQRLAEARLELAISPAGSRHILHQFRKTWDLPRITENG